MLIQISNGSKFFGEKTLFNHLDFMIEGKEKIALVGLNGVGKTTLLRILLNKEELDHGEIHKQNKLSIGYLDQKAFIDYDTSVKDAFNQAIQPILDIQKQMNNLEQSMKTSNDQRLLERYASLQATFEDMGGYTHEVEMKTLLTRFGFNQEDLSRQISSFSGGQKTRLAFIQMLLSKPDILLLDEPTNHLDISTIEWLEGYLKNYNRAMVIVSHDRLFMDRVCDTVVELEHQRATRYKGNYSSFTKQKEMALERQETLYQNQQKEIERLEVLIEKFRYKKSKAAFAQSKIKYLDRMEKVESVKKTDRTFNAHFKSKVRGGKQVLTCHDLVIGYDTPLATINLEILRSNRIGVVGDNGTGKSTFLKTIVEKLRPLSGEMLLGHQIEIGYFDQELGQFNPLNTVLEELWDAYPDLDRTAIRTVLGQFLFKGEDVFKGISVLSGGEKVRLALAKLLLRNANFLILDEPTNHLDIPAKEALEDALSDYDGTLLFVSHDRYFINKLATSILRFENSAATLTERDTAVSDRIDEVKANDEKEARKSVYINKKQLIREQEKIEKQIAGKQQELNDHRELRFDPDYYHDYQKMQDLDSRIDDIHNDIAHLEERWTQILEALENEN